MDDARNATWRAYISSVPGRPWKGSDTGVGGPGCRGRGASRQAYLAGDPSPATLLVPPHEQVQRHCEGLGLVLRGQIAHKERHFRGPQVQVRGGEHGRRHDVQTDDPWEVEFRLPEVAIDDCDFPQ